MLKSPLYRTDMSRLTLPYFGVNLRYIQYTLKKVNLYSELVRYKGVIKFLSSMLELLERKPWEQSLSIKDLAFAFSSIENNLLNVVDIAF